MSRTTVTGASFFSVLHTWSQKLEAHPHPWRPQEYSGWGTPVLWETPYQVLLAEELSRCGVELVFLKAPSGTTPEDKSKRFKLNCSGCKQPPATIPNACGWSKRSRISVTGCGRGQTRWR